MCGTDPFGVGFDEVIDLLKERQARIDRGEVLLLDWDKVKFAIGRGTMLCHRINSMPSRLHQELPDSQARREK
jgi:hypothetical protein